MCLLELESQRTCNYTLEKSRGGSDIAKRGGSMGQGNRHNVLWIRSGPC